MFYEPYEVYWGSWNVSIHDHRREKNDIWIQFVYLQLTSVKFYSVLNNSIIHIVAKHITVITMLHFYNRLYAADVHYSRSAIWPLTHLTKQHNKRYNGGHYTFISHNIKTTPFTLPSIHREVHLSCPPRCWHRGCVSAADTSSRYGHLQLSYSCHAL
jgi:hypothetical protein